MKKFISNKFFHYFLGVILIFLIWFFLAIIIDAKNTIPGPIETILYTFKLFKEKYTYLAILNTFGKLLIGYISALVIAFGLGIISARIAVIKNILSPFISVCKSLPTAAILYLLVFVLFNRAPIAIVFILAFPILYDAIVIGLNNIDKNIEDSLKIDGNNEFKKTFSVRLPVALPYIFVGLASTFALSFKTIIMAEIIAGGTGYGLGTAITLAKINDASNLVPVFSYCLIVVIIILILDLTKDFLKTKIKIGQ